MPEETFCRLLDSADEFLFRMFSVLTADMLFFTTIDIVFFLLECESLFAMTDIHARLFYNRLCGPAAAS